MKSVMVLHKNSENQAINCKSSTKRDNALISGENVAENVFFR